MNARIRWTIVVWLVLTLVWSVPVNAAHAPGKGGPEDPGVATPPPPEKGHPGDEPFVPGSLVIGLQGQTGGLSVAVAKRNNNVYLGMGPRLAIFDVTNPAAPTLLGRSIVLTSTIRWIQTESGWAYVLDTAQLHIFDMSTPSLPTRISSKPIPGDVNAGVYSPTATLRWVWVAAGSQGGVIAVNVTNRASPIVYQSTAYNSPGQAVDLTRSNNFLYLADGTSGLRVVDITNPSSPQGRGGAGVGSGEYSFRSVAVYGNYAYVGTTSGKFRVFNVSNPDQPQALGSLQLPVSSTIYGIFVYAGQKAYVAADSGGVFVVNLTNPNNPSLIGSYNTAGRAQDVWYDNAQTKLYVADWYGLRVLDTTTPNPTQVSVYPAVGRAQSVAVQGNYAYVGDMDFGVRVVNVSDPASMSVVGSYNVLTTTQDVFASGNYVYAVARIGGLHVLDVTNPAAPSLCGSYTTGGMNAAGVWSNGNYAYVADLAGYLRVIDVNPCGSTAPVGLATVPSAVGVVVSGTYAYVASGSFGLKIVNIATPNNPFVVGPGYDPPGYVNDVAVLGTQVFLACDTAGIYQIDVSNPNSPVLVANTATTGVALDIAVWNNLVYVADASEGLHLYTTNTFGNQGRWDSPAQAYALWLVPISADSTRVFMGDSEGGLDILVASGSPLQGRLLTPLIRR
jgi:hypothetical protein